jgi:hypothetical protein
MFHTTNLILDAWYPPEKFYIFIVYGPLGYGKSAYSFKLGVEVLKKVYHIEDNNEAWEKLKQFIIFHPVQFFEKIEQIEESRLRRIPFLIWEDAGLWLYAMEWSDPFIESFIKYLNVARTHLAALICSSPSPEWVLRKLRRFPSAYTVKIIKETGNTFGDCPYRRLAKIYEFWIHPDLKHSGVRSRHVDEFNCKMPDDFYVWYKPIRDSYEDMALNVMKEKWNKLKEQSKALLIENYPQLQNLSMPKINITY